MALESVEKCTRLLTEKELTLAFVESASGGILCGEFALVPGSEKYIRDRLARWC